MKLIFFLKNPKNFPTLEIPKNFPQMVADAFFQYIKFFPSCLEIEKRENSKERVYEGFRVGER